MASLFDVMDRLQQLANDAVTPNGPETVFGRYIDVGQGWPLPEDIDKAFKANRSLITIYAVPSSTSDPGQVMNWDAQTIDPPVRGLTAYQTDAGFALQGDPGLGEYITVILDGNEAFSYAAVEGDLGVSMAGRIASEIGPRATWSDNAVSLTGIFSLLVRIGAPARMGELLHRQRQMFRVVVWSPNPQDRSSIGTALDLTFKQNLKLILRDTSTALMTYGTTNLDDARINSGIYRADLMWSVLWDTYAVYPAYEVTAVDLTLNDASHVVQ